MTNPSRSASLSPRRESLSAGDAASGISKRTGPHAGSSARSSVDELAVRTPGTPHVVAAFDKFRHTANAADLCATVGDVAWEAGWSFDAVPLGDGGEGTLEVLAAQGGTMRTTTVSGPLGDPVEASWLFRGSTAFIEMARASGLELVGGSDGNDALDASTFGTGELMVAALGAGAKRIVVALGGSATTDGGFGALRAMEPLPRFRGVKIVVACDVETRFVDAAAIFGPQKGASSLQVNLLTRRLERLADVYRSERGVDVRDMPGSGAAGGLAGGLLSIGAVLMSGFALVADETGLYDKIAGADLVVTGEGFVDEQSFNGKVVGGVCEAALDAGVGVLVVGGNVERDLQVPEHLRSSVRGVISLVERFGEDHAWTDPVQCVRTVVSEHLAG